MLTSVSRSTTNGSQAADSIYKHMLNIRPLDAAGYFFVHVEEGVEEREVCVGGEDVRDGRARGSAGGGVVRIK